MSAPRKIETMFAFIARDEEGNEGVTGFLGPNGWVPLVGADMSRMDALRPVAQHIARASGKSVHLVHFSHREEKEMINP